MTVQKDQEEINNDTIPRLNTNKSDLIVDLNQTQNISLVSERKILKTFGLLKQL